MALARGLANKFLIVETEHSKSFKESSNVYMYVKMDICENEPFIRDSKTSFLRNHSRNINIHRKDGVSK